jgi:hypothetical protein
LPVVQLDLPTWQLIGNENVAFEYSLPNFQEQSILSPKKQNSQEEKKEEELTGTDIEGADNWRIGYRID